STALNSQTLEKSAHVPCGDLPVADYLKSQFSGSLTELSCQHFIFGCPRISHCNPLTGQLLTVFENSLTYRRYGGPKQIGEPTILGVIVNIRKRINKRNFSAFSKPGNYLGLFRINRPHDYIRQ